MDRKSKELARKTSDIILGRVTPEYKEVREQLLGNLSRAGLAHEGLRAEAAEMKANLALLQAFINTLPVAGHYKHSGPNSSTFKESFAVEDLATIHAIQKSTVWHKSFWSTFTPYYVVGSRIDEEKGSLLLADATGRGTKYTNIRLARMTTSKKKVKNILSLLKPYDTPIDEDKLKSELYDPSDDKLKLWTKSPGSVYISSFGLPNVDTRFLVRNKNVEFDLIGITDYEWGVYNVQDHLNKLAMLFGKEEVLSSIFTD